MEIKALNVAGITVNTLGGAWYTVAKYRMRLRRDRGRDWCRDRSWGRSWNWCRDRSWGRSQSWEQRIQSLG